MLCLSSGHNSSSHVAYILRKVSACYLYVPCSPSVVSFLALRWIRVQISFWGERTPPKKKKTEERGLKSALCLRGTTLCALIKPDELGSLCWARLFDFTLNSCRWLHAFMMILDRNTLLSFIQVWWVIALSDLTQHHCFLFKWEHHVARKHFVHTVYCTSTTLWKYCPSAAPDVTTPGHYPL